MVDESELISLSLQQANVLFTSNHNNGFSTYLNVEMLNSLSTMQGFGHISIEDAFVKYNHNQTLNIKLGYFTPTFNSFNEIYNKFPLMPYAYRPFMYEKALANIINPEDICSYTLFRFIRASFLRLYVLRVMVSSNPLLAASFKERLLAPIRSQSFTASTVLDTSFILTFFRSFSTFICS